MASSSIRGGYWPTWINSELPPSSINLALFTHLFYAFLQVDPSTFQLIVTNDDDRMLRAFSEAAHGHSPRVQALLSIGGGDSTSAFAALAADPASRAAFIQSTIAVARQAGFNGLDLDWEHPIDTDEMANFGRLVTEWRAAVEADSGQPRLLLTAAVRFEPSFQWEVPRSYPVAEMASALDWINSMAYDLHGPWEPNTTGLHAALYDPTGAGVSGSDGVTAWVNAGMPAAKVVLGMPLYGRTWRLTDSNQNGVGAPAAGTGPGTDGVLRYSEVVQFNRDNGATVIHDVNWGEAYSYAGTSWVGYDDAWTAERKVEYARGPGIGGYFFWSIGQDDAAWTVTTAACNAWQN
ncbi:class V chitinase CHIT5-like [Zingiber officinale]|uniref:class V chitinase CHIT5-like n=1 Tax=Zingiber officinale TaxID=94328 RepID=UPI001C4C82B1|nr:class V chitinase CHIT5-like [Zingiber officinale]